MRNVIERPAAIRRQKIAIGTDNRGPVAIPEPQLKISQESSPTSCKLVLAWIAKSAKISRTLWPVKFAG
jgi:hypothetical protein